MKKYILHILVGIPFLCFSQSKTENIKEIKSNQIVAFTENKGQVYDQNNNPRPDVLFSGNANGLVYHLRQSGISYQLNKIDSWKEEEEPKTKQKIKVQDQCTIYRLDINWINSNISTNVIKDKACEGYTNYYLQSCPTGALNVKSYQEITYVQIYKGIDLKWYLRNGSLEYDYLLDAGADYKQIQLKINGAEEIRLNNKGEVIIKTPLGEIIEKAPLVKQNGKILKSRWLLKNNIISFDILGVNKNLSFVIDPIVAVRSWGTYYGGPSIDLGQGCATDLQNNVYLTGTTELSGSLLATTGSYQSVLNSNKDSYLAKFNPSGQRLWGTYYGGSGDDLGMSCVTDKDKNIYMAGYTQSNAGPIMATVGSHQPTFGGATDGFLVKFDSTGVRLWGTFYGGAGNDFFYACSMDGNNIYVSGATATAGGTIIATPTSQQPLYGGGYRDALIVKFNTNGIRQWATYYGGSDQDEGWGCSVKGNYVYMSGLTLSGNANSISTPGSYQYLLSATSNQDAFLVLLDSNGIRQWGTYYGGTGLETGRACVTDSIGNIYLSGQTNTSISGIMTTPGSHQTIYGGGIYDAYLAKFNAVGSIQWGTYYGSTGDDQFFSCDIDKFGGVYVSGYCGYPTTAVIATPGSHQTVYGGGSFDATLIKFDTNGIRQWGTFYSGALYDLAWSCCVDRIGNCYIAGRAESNTGTSIATPGSFQPTFGGSNYDGFLAKFFDCTVPNAPVNSTPLLNQTICEYNSATLFATSPSTLNWYANLTSTTALATGSVLNTATLSAGTYSYYVEAMSCAASLSRTEITVTVNPSPSITVNSGAICAGDSFTINPVGANTYTYSSGTAVVSPTINTSYSVTGAGINSCVSQTAAIINITVNALPTITVNSGAICIGDSFTINPTGANSYTYSSGTPIVSPTVNTSYSVTGTSSAGCVSSSVAVTNITVNALPTIAANNGSVCSGNSFTINPTGANTYTFSSGTPIVSPTITTTYSVSGTNAFGCVGDTTCNVSVAALPNVNVIASNTLICANTTASLTANGAATYTWGSGNTSTVEVITPTITTTYTLTGTDANGCQNAAIITMSVDLCAGINNKVTEQNIKIYPNPTAGNFTVELNEPAQISIYNTLGQIIYHQTKRDLKNEISLSGFANGTYFIKIEFAKTSPYVTKIIKSE